MVYGVEPRHAGKIEGHRAGNGNADIDGDKCAGEGRKPGKGTVAVIVRRFHLQERHAANPQERQNEQSQRDDPDAAQPVQQRTPHQKAARHVIQTGNGGRSRSGYGRNRFEDRLPEGDPETGEVDRQSAGDGKDHPKHVYENEAEPLAEDGRRPPGRGCRQEGQTARQKGADCKNLPMGIAVIKIDKGGDKHGCRKIHAADGCDMECGPEKIGVQGKSHPVWSLAAWTRKGLETPDAELLFPLRAQTTFVSAPAYGNTHCSREFQWILVTWTNETLRMPQRPCAGFSRKHRCN
jgi:hypothetical protein